MTLYSKSLSEYSVIPWISCKGEEGFIENTMDIFSIVNSTYAPLIVVRRVNECFWWDHESHMIDHVLPMSERHLLEEYEVSTICLMKWIDGATHLHEDLRKISNIGHVEGWNHSRHWGANELPWHNQSRVAHLHLEFLEHMMYNSSSPVHRRVSLCEEFSMWVG